LLWIKRYERAYGRQPMFRLSMSLRVMESDTIVRVYIHHFLLVIQPRAFFEISGDIGRKCIFRTPRVFNAPADGVPSKVCAADSTQKIRMIGRNRVWKTFDELYCIHLF